MASSKFWLFLVYSILAPVFALAQSASFGPNLTSSAVELQNITTNGGISLLPGQMYFWNSASTQTLSFAFNIDAVTMIKVTVCACSSNNGLPTITYVYSASVGDPRYASWTTNVYNPTGGDFFQPPMVISIDSGGDCGIYDFAGGGHAYSGSSTSGCVGNTPAASTPSGVNYTWTPKINGRGLGANEKGIADKIVITTMDKINAYNSGTLASPQVLEEQDTITIVAGSLSMNMTKTALQNIHVQKDYAVQMKTSATAATGVAPPGYGQYVDLWGCSSFTSGPVNINFTAQQFVCGTFSTWGAGLGGPAFTAPYTVGVATGPAGYEAIYLDRTYGIGASAAYIAPQVTYSFQISVAENKFYQCVVCDGSGQSTPATTAYSLALPAGSYYQYRAAIAWGSPNNVGGGLTEGFRLFNPASPAGDPFLYLALFTAAGTGTIAPSGQDIGTPAAPGGTAVSSATPIPLAASVSLTGSRYGSASLND